MVQWINEDGTVRVRTYQDSEYPRRQYLEVCTRPDPGAAWGPPVRVEEDR